MTPAADGENLRYALAEKLAKDGVLRSPQWRAAVESVPREIFLGYRVYQRVEGEGPTLWRIHTPDDLGPDTWLQMAYRDETLVTQLDRTDADEHQNDDLVPGEPTSSSTLPSLVVRMLEDLDVDDDSTVLEIGTGTGYSSALMCARLGSERVTSIEVDPGVAERAERALAMAGYTPRLIRGEGLAGYSAGAPYDRLIATCSVRHLPQPWLRQVGTGGRILVTVSGWLLGSGLARLRITAPGHAEGRFLPGFVRFMHARAHAAPPLRRLPEMTDYVERETGLGPDVFDDWTGRFIAQLAAPGAQYFPPFHDADPPMHLICDQAGSAWARVYRTSIGGWKVRQAGPMNLWDDIEQAMTAWQAAGRPPQHDFGITIAPDSQTVWLDTPAERMSWALPLGQTA